MFTVRGHFNKGGRERATDGELLESVDSLTDNVIT